LLALEHTRFYFGRKGPKWKNRKVTAERGTKNKNIVNSRLPTRKWRRILVRCQMKIEFLILLHSPALKMFSFGARRPRIAPENTYQSITIL